MRRVGKSTTLQKRLLALTGGVSLAAFLIMATLAKAAVFEPVLPHKAGPGVILMPCLCRHLPTPAEDKTLVEEAMRAAVIPAAGEALTVAPLSVETSGRLDLIAHAKKSVHIAVNNPSRELMQALIHAQERHVQVSLFTDDAGWEHARLLIYRGGRVHVVEFPKPVLVADDHIVDVDGKVTKDDKLAEDYLIDFVALVMKSVEKEGAARW